MNKEELEWWKSNKEKLTHYQGLVKKNPCKANLNNVDIYTHICKELKRRYG